MTIPTPPFVFGAKSQQRLNVACDMIRFYNTIGRTLTAANLQWTTTMSKFKDLWKSIVDRKDKETPMVPKITKTLPIMKWTEAFSTHLRRCIGVRYIPLSYVIREVVNVPGVCPPLKTDQPYSTLHGSVEEDMIARASHSDGLYDDDNASVFNKLEEATRSTTYASSITPFKKKLDGRAAFLALVAQYAGNDKWEIICTEKDVLLHTRKWKGQSNYSLEKFVQLHRNSYITMTECAQHFPFQLPNDSTRVRYLLDAIENDDPKLQAAIANVNDDTAVNGKRHNFDLCAAYILPQCPVAKRRTTSEKRSAAQISTATAEKETSTKKPPSEKKGIGSTGVHLRYHKPGEYNKLTPEQRKELQEWRTNSKGATTKKQRREASIAAAVAKQVQDELAKQHTWRPPADEGGTSKAAIKAFIMSAFEEDSTPPPPKTKKAAVASAEIPKEVAIAPVAPTLASILKQAKNETRK